MSDPTEGADDSQTAGRPSRELGVRGSVVVVLLSQVAGVLVMIGVPMIMVRTLSKADFGRYAQFQLLLQTFLIFAIAGFPEALVYFVARKRGAAADFLLGALIQLGVALSVIVTVAMIAGPTVLNWVVDPGMSAYLVPTLLAVVFYAVGDTLFAAQTAQKRFRSFSVIYVLFSVLQAGLVAGATFVWRSLDAVIWAYVVAGGAKALAALVYIGREVAMSGWTARPRMLRQQWAYSLPYMGTQILKKINGLTHKFFVTSSYSAESFAVYDIASKKVPALGLIRGSFVQVMTPHFAEMEEQKRHKAILSLWHASASRLSLIYYPITAVLIAFAPEAITVVFTSRYSEAIPIFRIFALLMIGDALGGIEALLKAFAQNRFILATTGLQLGIALIGSWLGLKWIGLPGPAIAVVASAWLGQWIRIARIHRLMGVPFADLLPWNQLGKCAALAAGSAFVGWVVGRTIASPLGTLFTGIPLTVVIYLIGAFALGLVPPSERERLTAAWRRLAPGRRD